MIPEAALEILGLELPVSRAELKGAFRAVALRSHPDVTQRKDSTMFRTAKDAYGTLLTLVPLAAGEVDEDVDVEEEDEVEPTASSPSSLNVRCSRSRRSPASTRPRRRHPSPR